MVLISIHQLLLFVFLWNSSLGQSIDAGNLLLSGLTVFQSTKNISRQNFNMIFQLKGMTIDDYFDDGFENKMVQFTIFDKKEKRKLEEISVVFDDSFMKIIDYNGKLIGVTEWIRSNNGKQIQVVGYFDKDAHDTFLLVEEVKDFKVKKRLLYQKLTFDEKVKLVMYMKSDKGEKEEEVNAGSVVTIVCKLQSKKVIKLKFESLEFQNQTMKLKEKKTEIRLTFRVGKQNHLKTIWCVADKIRQSLTIKVLHRPTMVRLKPAESDSLMAGGHLQCFAVDGYPQPTITWITTSVPPLGNQFYRINQITKSASTFVLKENAPIGSVWTIKCRSTNRIGDFSFTTNFTVEMNQTTLLANRVSKLEQKVQQLEGVSDLSVKEEQLVVVGNAVDYDNAIKLCKAKEMNLLKISNTETNNAVFKFATSKNIRNFWIDGNRRNIRKQWVDSYGIPLKYTNWAPGEPNNQGGRENCIMSWKHVAKSNVWNDVTCAEKFTAICYETTEAQRNQRWNLVQRQSNLEMKLEKIIGVNELAINSSQLLLVGRNVNQATAINLCKSRGMNLIRIRSTVTAKAVDSFRNFHKVSSYWIDGTYQTQRRIWQYSDGRPLSYFNWIKGEPNGYLRDEKCIHYKSSPGGWNDIPCSTKLDAICFGSAFDATGNLLQDSLIASD